MVLWETADPAAVVAGVAAVAELQRTHGWGCALKADGLQVWTGLEGGLPVSRAEGGHAVVVGRAHDRAGLGAARLPASPGASPEARLAERFLRDRWGSYVAVLEPREGRGRWLLRDPTGGLEAIVWRRGALTVVGSGLDGAPRALGPALHLRWDRVAAQLLAPALFAGELAFDGARALEPGALVELGVEADEPRAIWRPDAMVPLEAAEARAMGAALPEILDGCLAAMTGGHEALVAEISGGFDSAAVASGLLSIGAASRVVQWINYRGDRPEGDERAYARAVAAGLGVDLTFVAKAVSPLTEADLFELCEGLRAPVNALDVARDRDMAARLCASRASGLVSGQGGDAVFFQMPSALVLADLVAQEGRRRVFSRALLETARWTRRGAWSVAAEALGIGGRSRRAAGGMAFLDPRLRAAAGRHASPWVDAARALPPAKRLQISALANCRIYRGASRRGAAAELIYPLLSQPMVETCLAMPSYVLVEGGRDRALARAAFGGRIPQLVLDRRSKGDLSSFYARTVAASLDMLRPFLLEGVLCEAGLLDRAALEGLLTPEQLIWRAGAGPILIAAMVEAWLRRWQGYAPDAAPRGLAVERAASVSRAS